MPVPTHLLSPLDLPNGARLRNRIVKAAMSDALGDGRGYPTPAQARLYGLWAEGGVAASIIGEVQGDPSAAEAPGNLLLGHRSAPAAFAPLMVAGRAHGTHLWLQLGHAGALTPPGIGTPRGPSALDLPGLRAAALTAPEIAALPDRFAATARQARRLGATGVQIHAAHGFLLSQFLSPLFNRRGDAHGGSIGNRMRLLLAVVAAVRAAVSPSLVLSVKLNASDQIAGGLTPDEALQVVAALDLAGIDLIDISGGTYFPGAASSSDRPASGPYFLDFAAAARRLTSVPLMATFAFAGWPRPRRPSETAHWMPPALPAHWCSTPRCPSAGSVAAPISSSPASPGAPRAGSPPGSPGAWPRSPRTGPAQIPVPSLTPPRLSLSSTGTG